MRRRWSRPLCVAPNPWDSYQPHAGVSSHAPPNPNPPNPIVTSPLPEPLPPIPMRIAPPNEGAIEGKSNLPQN
ncbi:hypothetical protein [Candidatus Chlorohelix sp.]|uniref:hypothetical protein n=1 Tax=Candidatus Chlorohelix sp. TaxID=3139201 RepID=UPI00306AD32E